MARTRSADILVTILSAGCGAAFAFAASLPALYFVALALSWLGVKLPSLGELMMAGPFLSGIAGFVFCGLCGILVWLSRNRTRVLSKTLTIVVAAVLSSSGAAICYWLLIAPRATVPQSTVTAGGIALPIAVGLAAGLVAFVCCLIPGTNSSE